jgi:hypothetical protein
LAAIPVVVPVLYIAAKMALLDRVIGKSRRHVGGWPAIVHARVPRAGIGNMLLVWARARVFASRNELQMVATGWGTPRVGPWLRGEERKRIYAHYFRPASPFLWSRARLLARLGQEVLDPAADAVVSNENKHGVVYTFSRIPDNGANYFENLSEWRSRLRSDLVRLLSPYCLWYLARAPHPVIGLHVRCGDFRPLQAGETLGRTSARTPIDFFCKVVEGIRRVNGRCLSATVFSDGTDADLAPLLALPSVVRAPKNPDFVDLLSLGRSKIVVGSAHSTFSQWGGFLSAGPFVRPHVEDEKPTRNPGSGVYDGGVDPDPASWPELLLDNLRSIPLAAGRTG